MDALRAVEAELENVFSKIENIGARFEESVTHLINFINNMKKRIDEKVKVNETYELTEDEMKSLNSLTKLVRITLQQTSTSHRAAHIDICKLGRSIDRNFDDELDGTTQDLLPNAEDPVRREKLNQAICEHFYREGMHDVGETMCKEAGMELRKGFVEPLAQQYQILLALKQKDLGPAIDWVSANRQKLVKNASKLEFQLHKLGFLLLVESGTEYQEEAVRYARENLAPFVGQYETEIKSLMGSLIYAGEGVHRSPYAHLFEQNNWDKAYEMFQKESCKVLKIPMQSPLPVCVATGSTAIRTRANVRQILRDRKSEHYWNVTSGLPVDTRLGEEFQYHSIFSCPILRQQTTDDNPPMRLACGHVISREALEKLMLTNRHNMKHEIMDSNELVVKCPYCPVQDKAILASTLRF